MQAARITKTILLFCVFSLMVVLLNSQYKTASAQDTVVKSDPGFKSESYRPESSITGLTAYSIRQSNQLIRFDTTTPGASITVGTISGIGSDSIVGIDFRPATQQLYALGSSSQLYTLDVATAVATAIGPNPGITFTGTNFGFDFNPQIDRIRVVNDGVPNGQNLVYNPSNGAVTVATALSGATNQVDAAAYSNNLNGATSTLLHVINTSGMTDSLYSQNNNGGVTTLIGSLGIDATAMNGFDIVSSGSSNSGFATLTVGGIPQFYRIDLSTGAASLIGVFGGASAISGLAVESNPIVGYPAYSLSQTNQLIRFNTASPNITTTLGNISGLQAGETILGIDFRPLTNQLYALGSSSQLYTLNTLTASASPVGANPGITFTGANYGFDFNPAIDRIRVVNDGGQNFVYNPDTGGVMTVTPLSGDTTRVDAAAYTNNFAGTSTTQLFVIDGLSNSLYTQTNSAGVTSLVQQLNVDPTSLSGFDIITLGTNNFGYAAFTVGGVTGLYAINLRNDGTATAADVRAINIGTIGNGTVAQNGLAIQNSKVSSLTAYGINQLNQLVTFDPANPTVVTTVGPIRNSSGAALETIVGIDIRPANQQLFGLGTSSQLYLINRMSGIATPVGPNPGITFTGTNFGFDFNPQIDRIRVVNDAVGGGQNLVYDPNTGSVTVATPISGATTQVDGAAYNQNTVGTQSTLLHVINGTTDSLYTQTNNAGVTTLIGSLGIDATGVNGFDIVTSGSSHFGFAALTVASVPNFYSINLGTGAATLLGPIGGDSTPSNNSLRGLAIRATPLPSTAASVEISGRVVTPEGRGIRNARVSITDRDGNQSFVTTSSFGYYTLENVEVGQSYVIGVQSKRYRFESRLVQLVDSLTDINFVGLE